MLTQAKLKMMSVFLQTLLIIHVASGFAALSTGFMSMLNQKGGKIHQLTGKIFFSGMSGVFMTAVILSGLKSNPFLFMVGFFSYYLTCSGYRALYLKNHSNQPLWIDWLINGTGLVFSVGLIVFSLSWFQSRGIWGFVPLTLGMFCLIIAVKDTFSFYQPQQQPYTLSRLISHGSRMGGAFAATVTAFIVVNFTFGNATWLLWILPGVLIGIWIRKTIQVVKAKLEQRKPPQHLRTQPTKGNILLIFVVFSAKLLWAQEVTLSGEVVNNRMEPIKYVSIGIVNKPIGTVSNDSGAFKIRLNRDLLSANDSLKLSSIGYHSKCVPIYAKLDEINEQHPFVLVLREKITELPDVVITAEKKIEKTKTIGTHKKSLLNLYVNFALENHLNQNLGSEIGRRFQIPKKMFNSKPLRSFLVRIISTALNLESTCILSRVVSLMKIF